MVVAGTIALLGLGQSDGHSAEIQCLGAEGLPGVLSDSRSCLSCHDGVIAKNAFSPGPADSRYAQPGNHPMMVSYQDAYWRNPMALVAPGALDARLRLVDGKVQCITCHEVSSQRQWTTVSLPGRREICHGCHRK